MDKNSKFDAGVTGTNKNPFPKEFGDYSGSLDDILD